MSTTSVITQSGNVPAVCRAPPRVSTVHYTPGRPEKQSSALDSFANVDSTSDDCGRLADSPGADYEPGESDDLAEVDDLWWDELFEPTTSTLPEANNDTWEMSTQIAYSYSPLPKPDDNRVLELDLDGHVNDADAVRCRLRTISLRRPPPYLTLSYVWGVTTSNGSHLDASVVCDRYPVRVTRTLDQVLKRIRRMMSGGKFTQTHCDDRIWVDAICINQTDMSERSRQVELMARIYQE